MSPSQHSVKHPEPVELDQLDRELITAVRATPGGNFHSWAGELDVSPHTVARHFSRLQRHGVLRVIGRTLPGFGGRMS